MSLFLKIFLWFWLVIALMVGAITLVNWSTQSEPLVRQWRVFVGEAVTVDSQTAVQIYEEEDLDGLEKFLERQRSRLRINTIGLFDRQRNLIAGDLRLAQIGDLFDASLRTERPEFKRFPDRTYVAKRVRSENGRDYIYVLELKRFQPPTFFTQRLILQILAVLLIGGLFCYLLARYLTSPIKKLRSATQRVAGGDFETRVAEKVGRRRDELSYLARDFDEMAERIDNLIGSEKRLTQDISHELRSPLARMNVALELARAKANPETAPLLRRIDIESARLNEMIGELLTLSKLETGSQNFEKTEVNLTKLVEGIVEDADFEAKVHDKRVGLRQDGELKVFGNEQLLRSAVENVLRNAVRYTPEGTEVEVSVARNGDGAALISIRDHGAGVPEEDLEKLFKPFYRVQEARDRKSGGIGLGLAIAERAVSNHHGRITARNGEAGLVVEIRLPLLKG